MFNFTSLAKPTGICQIVLGLFSEDPKARMKQGNRLQVTEERKENIRHQ